LNYEYEQGICRLRERWQGEEQREVALSVLAPYVTFGHEWVLQQEGAYQAARCK